MLTSREIRMILDSLRTQRITLVVENGKVGTDITKDSGYSTNAEVGALQAKLSIMLEVAGRAGR
jgi:hypothetical protein